MGYMSSSLSVSGGSSSVAGLASALLYGVVAIAMNFVNKATLMEFGNSNFILILQSLAGIAIVHGLRALGMVKVTTCRKRMMKVLPLTLLYQMNIAFALKGLLRVNVPTYSTVKRLTPMLVLSAKVCMSKKLPHPLILFSVFMVVLGCIVAGAGDLSFDAAGYAFAFMSCSTQAAYLVLVEYTGSEKGVGSTELLLYNSVLSLPFLLVIVALTGELSTVRGAYLSATSENALFPLLLILCSCMGCLLNYSIFLCTMNNSALTTTIVGVLKGVLSTVLGFFLLGGVKFNLLNVLGISMNTVGGVMYTIVKYKRKALEMKKANGKDLEASIPLMRKEAK